MLEEFIKKCKNQKREMTRPNTSFFHTPHYVHVLQMGLSLTHFNIGKVFPLENLQMGPNFHHTVRYQTHVALIHARLVWS